MPAIRITGKIIPDRIPAFILPAALETMPASVGPPEQPRSPPKAIMANIAVPPLGTLSEHIEKTPGQRMPTEKPHKAQPISPKTADPESDASR